MSENSSEKKTILRATVQTVTHQGREIRLDKLDQAGLRVVRKFAPNAVTETEYKPPKVTEIGHDAPKEKPSKSDIPTDVAGKADGANAVRKRKVARKPKK